jgi:hypothetical protein
MPRNPRRFDRIQVRAFAGAVLGVYLWFGSGGKGNDTGGIIPWRPGAAKQTLAQAGAHCMRYRKYAVITSVHPWYGDYVGFQCRQPRRWGPAYN